MLRLIDISEWSKFLHKKLDNIFPESIHDRGYRHAIQDVDAWLAEHAIEAEPVRHGQWVWKDFNGDGSVILCCSECLETEGARENADYCSACGAKMDKE